MNRLPLVLCVLALAGAVASAGLFFQIGNSKRLLETQLAAANARGAALDQELAALKVDNDSLGKRLTALDADLGDTKSKLTTSDARNAQLNHELAQVKVQLAARELASQQLAAQIASLQREVLDGRASGGGAASPEAIDAYRSTIADLERRLADAQHGAAVTDAPAASTATFASRPRASILSVGPANAFVVLDYGAGRGAQTGQQFTIHRGTDTLAMVLISDVRPHFCVAQVQPDSLRGALQKGDFAVLSN